MIKFVGLNLNQKQNNKIAVNNLSIILNEPGKRLKKSRKPRHKRNNLKIISKYLFIFLKNTKKLKNYCFFVNIIIAIIPNIIINTKIIVVNENPQITV